MWCAPAAVASRAFASPLTVVITSAPAQRASWIAALPTAPAPPATSTVLPASASGPSRAADAGSELEVGARREREDAFGGDDGELLCCAARRTAIAGKGDPDAIAG